MTSLQATKDFFFNRTAIGRQRLGSDDNKVEGNYHSDVSDTSRDNLEGAFSSLDKIKKPGWVRRIIEYGRRRKTTFADWSSAQPRSVWASVILAVLATVVILVLTVLLIYFNIHLRRQIPRNDIQRIVASWGAPGSLTQAEEHYSTDFSRDIIPIPCHSHNDYWRKVPLYDALAAGCTGVEADVWLTNNDLLVGHSTGSLTSARSLTSLYIDPLISILAHQNPPLTFQNTTTSTPQSNSTTNSASLNGVFEINPATSLTLLIDVKSNGTSTFPVILQQLEPLRSRGYLTYFDGSAVIPGPITVVGSGNTPFDLLISNTTYRDIFFDAPLDQLWGENAPSNASLYTSENSYYASVNFASAIGKPWHGSLEPQQVDTILGQSGAAAAKGLKARYWNTPAWPVGVRDHIWDVLEKEGVGMLNVDDLTSASQRNWGG
ncbi:Altered inheritance of mitochondria protein 6 [Imshaugia aleurites]|uniref:Altered inheritance of mitochondria protein 6 n=1 Tax=Imshaugia aleurites TaxID=172621 RepID=A0A8H3IS79_9LECA|nr:Altered inheritance of mitochondria protein 6 [Imshaugia aleurites]